MYGFAELFASYQSERFLGEGNRTTLPEVTLLDFYAGIGGERWSLTAYVLNLSDEDKPTSGVGNVDFTILPDFRAPPQAMSVYLPQPRTVGGRVTVRFGE